MNRKMIALIIGNGNYQYGTKLKNAVNDANDVASALEQLSFIVTKHLDCEIQDLDRAVSAFQDGLNSNDVGLFYFAGHGIQIEGQNYITAIDSSFIDESAVKYTSYPLNRLIEVMDSCSNKTNLIILDACRDNPCERAWTRSSTANSLAPMFAPKGTLIAYSTSPGETASDGVGNNGAYTEALLKHINKPDIPIEDMFKKVRNSLSVVTKGKQTSWEHTSLTGDFYFNLSLGNKINKYSKLAISDALFVLDDTNAVHKTIISLKIHNWYTQNPVIDNITSTLLSTSDDDTLFVLGRNIYQAACGNSTSAIRYINSFHSKHPDLDISKKLSILDGMLFEIFFNSKAEFRDTFKSTMFNEVFNLSIYPEYQPSFDFISEILLPYSNHFYIIPGKNIGDVSIELVLEKSENESKLIKEVHYNGENILEGELGWENYSFNGNVLYDSIRYESFIERLSKDMMIPERYISVHANEEINRVSKLQFPYKHTLKRS
ncbi:caspase family protein [Aeromonas veronii]|uniref:caspase family protein n=1 Tax=Aeromonas TaxID=642 RepID=UPI0013DF43A0|nr:caspase family protein [Aeromonas veronii]MBL0638649.1 caspase family protein [Aeromonas veronii]MCV3283110.1 caspase family protein [Aeromonas veronii]QIF44824.1 caspase family protein [Aeromonas veronii]